MTRVRDSSVILSLRPRAQGSLASRQGHHPAEGLAEKRGCRDRCVAVHPPRSRVQG